MVVLDPLKVVITNFPEDTVEVCLSENNPEDPNGGMREVPFSREVYIEREDFMENPPKKYFRLAVGQMVRLKSAYIIRCDEVIKDEAGNVLELRCSYLENSKSGNDTSGINVKGTLHWVSVSEALPIEIRQYDRLFKVEDLASAEGDFKDHINPNSLEVITGFAEPSLKEATVDTKIQFVRKGYFCLDTDATPEKLIFNRTVGLKDTWGKVAGK